MFYVLDEEILSFIKWERNYIMNSYAILRNENEYTVFEFNVHIIRFMTSSRLEKYTKILERDHGYIVVALTSLAIIIYFR